MNKDKLVENFNYFEKLFFRITLGLLGASVAAVVLSFVILEQLGDIPKAFINITISMLLASGVNFLISLFRLFKFAFKISGKEGNIGITRTVTSLVLNPVTFIILYILLIILALSSCSVQ
ncbi:MAG: hypothetical protein QM489_06010 [Candidatus Izemoplasma sp.]